MSITSELISSILPNPTTKFRVGDRIKSASHHTILGRVVQTTNTEIVGVEWDNYGFAKVWDIDIAHVATDETELALAREVYEAESYNASKRGE